jgi:hypothetical protein
MSGVVFRIFSISQGGYYGWMMVSPLGMPGRSSCNNLSDLQLGYQCSPIPKPGENMHCRRCGRGCDHAGDRVAMVRYYPPP